MADEIMAVNFEIHYYVRFFNSGETKPFNFKYCETLPQAESEAIDYVGKLKQSDPQIGPIKVLIYNPQGKLCLQVEI
jgi:hypothetical protein